jgi:hypothetical protein
MQSRSCKTFVTAHNPNLENNRQCNTSTAFPRRAPRSSMIMSQQPKTSTRCTLFNWFLAGWRTLPDELKLEVLRCTVPNRYIYVFQDFEASKEDVQPRPETQAFRDLVVPLLSVPEIRGLVLEVFCQYSQVLGPRTTSLTHDLVS